MPVPESASQAAPAERSSPSRDIVALLGEQKSATSAISGGKHMVVPRRSYPFLLRHHESNWHLATDGLPEAMLLPEIVPQILMAGAAGIRTVDRGEALSGMYASAKAKAIAKGWHYIDLDLEVTDPTHLPEGVKPGPWLRQVEAVRQGTTNVIDHFYTPWDVPVRTPADLPQRWRFDLASFNRWRLHLCVTGAIPDPIPSVIEELRAKYGEHAERARGRNNPDREHKDQKIRAAQKIADTAAAAALPVVEAPAPKSKRKGGAA